jgi:hypothetical protein
MTNQYYIFGIGYLGETYDWRHEMNDKDLTKNPSIEGTYKWYSWDSPLGLGLFLVCLAAVGVLIHFAIALK